MADEVTLLNALKQVVDPELMINVVDLGLVYAINQEEDNKVTVDMTLTSPACPAGPQIISQAKMALENVEGVKEAQIKLVMSPPWSTVRAIDANALPCGSRLNGRYDVNIACIRCSHDSFVGAATSAI
jgi:metal-sulfur cluster biosynthetic enzyme